MRDQQAGQLSIAGDLYQQAAVTWGIAGEVDKAGDSFAKAAKEVRHAVYCMYL